MPTQTSLNRACLALTIAVVAAFSAYLLYPALFLDRSLVHGDNMHHGYAMMKFHHDVIHNGVSPLWTNLIYGGHALFAESQAGLSNPVNYLVAWLLPPEFGHNLIHWLAMTAFGIGCYGLARSLAISPVGALYAALAAGVSSLAINTNANMVVIEAMAWLPWTLWAFESWLGRPDFRRAIVFGLATAMLVFSGYPHFLHGAVIYMLASLCTLFTGGPLRETMPKTLQTHWRSGLLAVSVCVAISCIQWLPLLELVGQSLRQEGVGIAFDGTTDLLLRGLLYSTDSSAATNSLNTAYLPNTGSLVVCFFASICLFVPSSARIKGHIVATVLLLNLGFGNLSPVYRFISSYGIIPGMDSFRSMFPYFIVSIIGVAILAGNSVDSLYRIKPNPLLAPKRGAWLRWTLVLAFWAAVLYHYHTDAAPVTNYVILVSSVFALLVLATFKKLRLFPLCACALLALEIILLKAVPFATVDNELLRREPAAVEYIKNRKDAPDFKHYQLGLVPLTFASPYSEALTNGAVQELNHLVASSNLLWGVPSFSGATALKSFRKPMVNDVVNLEIEGSADDRPGSRLMDLLSVKWISKAWPIAATSEHLVPVKDDAGRLMLWENPHALPRVQTYQRAQFVDSAEQALQALQTETTRTLFVEAAAGNFPDYFPSDADGDVRLRRIKTSPTLYRFVSNSSTGFWLFLADTWYPGWHASVDDEAVPVYPAQVLGKAIFVPPGEHGIKIYFRSDSFRLGALVSALTVLCLLLYCARAIFLRTKHP